MAALRCKGEVAGTRWLVIGFGAIGQAVAQRARGFGASIVGVRRSGAPDPLADRMGSLDDVRRLLPDADVVVLATPLNPQTRGIADEGFFAAMKAGSVLVNVGRGGLVDEPALARALKKGRLAGAILDVFATEPLPKSSPLWDTPNLMVVPHVSSDDEQAYMPRNYDLFFRNARRFLAGRGLMNLIDPTREY